MPSNKKPTDVFKHLPEYLQPRILSAVAFVNAVAPDLDKAVERINTVSKFTFSKRDELGYAFIISRKN